MGKQEEGGGGRQVGRPARASKAKGFKGNRCVADSQLLTTTAVLQTFGFSQLLRGMLRDKEARASADTHTHTHTHTHTCSSCCGSCSHPKHVSPNCYTRILNLDTLTRRLRRLRTHAHTAPLSSHLSETFPTRR